MKKLQLIIILISLLMTSIYGQDNLSLRIKFASVERANELLQQEDNFTDSWSQFDIDSRMHKPNSSKADLLNYISTQIREWTPDEMTKLALVFQIVDQKIKEQGFAIDFPNDIYFIKTTAEEEGGAGGYTRANYVVLQEAYVSKASEDDLMNIVVHELFHVLTRHNPEFRKAMYNIIGFKIMNEVQYPEKIRHYRITNPDAPQVDSYITLQVDGQYKDCMMILYSNRDYVDGHFFKYLNIGFLSLIGGENKSVEYKADMPVIYSMQDVSGFYEQVGKNTQYIIHPEEICADNFVHTILSKKDLSDPEIIDKIRGLLKR